MIRKTITGEYVVKAHDEERWRTGGGASASLGGASGEGGGAGAPGGPMGARTHSEGRPPPTGASSLGSTSRYFFIPFLFSLYLFFIFIKNMSNIYK